MTDTPIVPSARETSDLLYGVKEIAGFLNMREKPARHRIDNGTIPTFKIGGTVCASRASLAAWIKQMAEAAAHRAG